jgi:AcrR family transcriptional regulator
VNGHRLRVQAQLREEVLGAGENHHCHEAAERSDEGGDQERVSDPGGGMRAEDRPGASGCDRREDREAEPARGEPVEALERVVLATWHKLSQFHALLAINTSRLSAKELHRRHLPVMTQFAPLIERGQKEGVFRSDVPISWHAAVLRAIVHAASAELRNGRLSEDAVEQTMITTVLAAMRGPRL